MAFYQLYYTSCERGMSGFAGFQFNAVTPGVSPETMRDVEQLTVYEPPRHLVAGFDRSPTAYPVNLLYTYTENSRSLVLARVQFAGADFSQRWGNYFAHVLVTETPDDLGDRLPIELWEAALWRTEPVDHLDLPLLRDALASGPLSRRSVADFLARQQHSHLLPALLSAAQDAMIGENQTVVLLGPDTETIARWIAALSYLLGGDLARRLTFSTYHRDPDYCPTHVVGTVALPETITPAGGFVLFDLINGEVGERTTHPAAPLLIRTGVEASYSLWKHAGELLADTAQSPPGSLSDWFPTLAAAAMLLGERLTSTELDAAIGWLAHADSTVAAPIDDVLDRVLAQPLEHLDPSRQRQLIDLAIPDRSDRVAEIELALVTALLGASQADGPPNDITALTSVEARRRAGAGAAGRLGGADGVTTVALLRWASTAHAQIPDVVVRSCGHGTIADELLCGRPLAGLQAVTGSWPKLRHGLLDRLATLSPAEQRSVLRMLPLETFGDDDFNRHPSLGEDWLVEAARQGHLGKDAALTRVLRLRHARRRRPAVDEELLIRLWPDGRWSPAEAAELLSIVPRHEFADGRLLDWLISVLHDAPLSEAEDHSWIRFLEIASAPSSEPLPAEVGIRTARLLRLSLMLREADRRTSKLGGKTFREFYREYQEADSDGGRLLVGRLPAIMAEANPVATELDQCPRPIFESLCRYLQFRLSAEEPDVKTAAWIFIALDKFSKASERTERRLSEVLKVTVVHWSSRDLKAVKMAAGRLKTNGAHLIDPWFAKNRGSRAEALLRWISGR